MFYFISPDATDVQSFKKEKDAKARVAQVEGSFLASDASSSLEDLPMQLLVELHNRVRPERPIKKFADRPTAVKRMANVLETLATPGTVTPEAEVVGEIKPKPEKAPKVQKEPREPKEGGRPRSGKLAGMTIIRLTKENPRKAGTSGGRSWDLLTEGMTVEEFLTKGGVRRDLEWDIDKGWTTTVPTAEYTAGIEAKLQAEYAAKKSA